jgi:hypothetical protein
MGTFIAKLTCCAAAILLGSWPTALLSRTPREKNAVYYGAGVPFLTDGSLANGACFRVGGRVDASDFFENLKRTENAQGAVFSRGTETVTQFPKKVNLYVVIRDHPCDPKFQQPEPHVYLTREMMSTMQLSLYWKNGVELQPVRDIKKISSSVEAITPYAKELAAELPKRFEWSWEWEVPSAGVPLTDSLVLIFRTPDGHIAARVAARL